LWIIHKRPVEIEQKGGFHNVSGTLTRVTFQT
jgi:hypothetical protein